MSAIVNPAEAPLVRYRRGVNRGREGRLIETDAVLANGDRGCIVLVHGYRCEVTDGNIEPAVEVAS